MSLDTSGPGSRGPGAETPEERASAGASAPAKGKTRKRPLPDVPPAKARTVEPHPVEPHPVEPNPATTLNGHALNGSAADGAVQPDRLTVVNGRRPRFRRRVMRWGALILLALLLVVVGAFAGSAVAAAMPTLYAAHSDVVYPLVQQQPTGFLREDRNLSTQQVLIASREVLDPVAAKFKVSADDLDKHLTTEVVNDSEVIRLQFTDPSRAQARKVLAAVVDRVT